MSPPLKRGEFVWLTAGAQSIKAMVCLASTNGRSIMLMFDGIVAGCVGMLPAIEDAAGGWTSVMDGSLLTIRRVRPEDTED